MIKIANAPCSWGVLEFDLEGEAAGFAQVLDEMVETGYAGTELGDWGFMPTDPEKLAEEIHARGLTLFSLCSGNVKRTRPATRVELKRRFEPRVCWPGRRQPAVHCARR